MEYLDIKSHIERISREITELKKILILEGVVINTGTSIGKHCIINTSSSLDHHNKISDFVHIAPGTHTGGNVEIDEGAFLGIGTSVIPGIKIGKWSIIGAGSVVIEDVPDYATVVGVPGRVIKRRQET
jgi:acetyltransferase EpsM